jgi:hypothetical protein
MTFCLPKHVVDDFLGKLKSGEINPEKLTDMTSEERNTFFASFMGETNAPKVNALFESKLLLKNQQLGIINWAKQVSGIKPGVKRDLLSRVQKMTRILQPKDMDSFLSDLAAQRLGVGVTMEEAGKIADLAKTTAEKKNLIPENSPAGSPERLEYGTALALFKEYVGGLKAEAKKLSAKELLTSPGELLQTVAGTAKSIAASLDNSFFGRQGLVTLITQPDIWMDKFLKSWGNISKELKGIDAMLPIRAGVWSRPNAINGKYKGIGLDIGLESEEAFPSQLPEKIPFFGRLYKASESAYNGAALEMRADLADRIIEEAESMEVDIMDKDAGIGILVNSMTGRGNVKLTPEQGKAINVLIFSVRYAKSNFDVLTAHLLDPKVGKFAKKKAAQNILKIIGVLGGILAVAKMLDPKSVEEDPRSSDFGKIMVGKNHEIKINITAGMNGLVTLASRIIPTTHNGKWGFWTKNSKGKYRQLGTGKYGVASPFDIITNFLQGKASPIARVLLDTWEGRTYSGEKPTVTGEAGGLVTPIPAQNLFELAKTSAGADPILYAILTALDLLGVNVSTKQNQRRVTR